MAGEHTEEILESGSGEGESQVDPAVEAKARSMGWAPKDKWRGDPAQWQDAAAFVETGERLVPFLKRDRARLEQELGATKQQIGALTATVQEAQEALAAFKEFHETAQKDAYNRALKDLRAQRAEAMEDNNGKLVNQIDEQIDELKEGMAAKPAPAPKPQDAAPAPQNSQDPAAQAAIANWERENAGWLADPEKRVYANSVAAFARQAVGPQASVTEFLDRVTEEVERRFGGAKPSSKSDGGSTVTTSNGRGKTFSDLPSDAKKACDDWGKKLVGKGKAYPTMEAWRSHYVSTYDWA